MTYFICSLLMTFSWALPQSDQALQLQIEYLNLKDLTRSLDADGMVGGLYYYKKYDGYEILWDKNDYEDDGHDTLRIFKAAAGPNKQAFSVTYIYSDYLLENTVTLRRFVGPTRKGWRADTVDLTSGDYNGWQGVRRPTLTEFEQEILKTYGILLFND